MDRRVDHCGGRAVTQHFGQKSVRNITRVDRILEPTLRGIRVALEPVEKLLAVSRDDVGLRIMNVGIDKSRNDQLAAVIDDRDVGRQCGHERARVRRRFDDAIRQHEQAVLEVFERPLVRLDRIRQKMKQRSAKRLDPLCHCRHRYGFHAIALPRPVRTTLQSMRARRRSSA